MAGYMTHQREWILTFLEQTHDHVTAEQVLDHLHRSGYKIARATIYRTLERLVEQGMVRKYILGDGKRACYQYAGAQSCHDHYHLKCESCGGLFHVECEFLDDMNRHIRTHHRFQINGAKTVLYGLCEACSQKREENEH